MMLCYVLVLNIQKYCSHKNNGSAIELFVILNSKISFTLFGLLNIFSLMAPLEKVRRGHPIAFWMIKRVDCTLYRAYLRFVYFVQVIALCQGEKL